jgi:hypothetical protein
MLLNNWMPVLWLMMPGIALAASPEGMEQCRVVTADKSVGLIKAGQADGIGSVGLGNTYKGLNIEGERNAYIWLPVGLCAKINAGYINAIPEEIRNKIHLDGLPKREEEEQQTPAPQNFIERIQIFLKSFL